MSTSAPSATTDSTATDLVSFKILADNKALSGEYRILSISCSKIFNRIGFAKISMVDGDPAKRDFTASSSDDSLVPGSDIEIQMGYHGKAKTIFKGIVTTHSIRSSKNKASTLTIEAKDKAVKLSLGRHSQTFSDKTDTEVIESIAKKSGYKSADIDLADTALKHTSMVQFNVSDWDFIVSRAEMNSLLVLTDDNKLTLIKPDTGQETVKEITYGKDVIEFDSALDGQTQIQNVVGHSWSFKDQKMQDSQTGSVKFGDAGNVHAESLADAFGIKNVDLMHGGTLSDKELSNWSNARLLKSRMSKLTGRIKMKGLTDIKPGTMIKLNGFGKRFNGNLYVTGINHSYDHTIWLTEILFGLPAAWFYERFPMEEKSAAGLLPGVSGLQIAIVMKIEGDPDKEHRVKVRLPLVDAKEGIWARIASLDAGKDRGSFFRPEVNDEVVLGFLNGDPRNPVIIGMLHSSAHPPPLEPKDANDEKGFITRSKMKMVFNDKKKTLRIETPKGKVVEVNDDDDKVTISDKNNNKIELGAKGVVMESAKDISISSSGGNVTIEGNSIECKARMKFSAKGNAGADLESTGQTVIKGGRREHQLIINPATMPE